MHMFAKVSLALPEASLRGLQHRAYARAVQIDQKALVKTIILCLNLGLWKILLKMQTQSYSIIYSTLSISKNK